jgi:hypothetical protein
MGWENESFFTPDDSERPWASGQDDVQMEPAGGKDLREQMGTPVGRLSWDENKAALARTVDGPFNIFESFLDLFGTQKKHNVIIVGGGPSLQDTLPDIKKRLRLSKKTKILAVNKSHDWLLERGIKPDFCAMCDPGQWISDYVTPQKGVKYLLGSALHNDTLNKFVRFDDQVYIWHGASAFKEGKLIDWAQETYPNTPLPFFDTVGSTIGLLAIYLSAAMGFRKAEIHGFDSCFRPGSNDLHAYAKPRPANVLGDVTVQSIKTQHTFRFSSDPNMARQALEFGDMMVKLANVQLGGKPWDMPIKVAGKGVIPWLAWKDGDFMVRHAAPWTMKEFEGIADVDYRPEWAKEQLKAIVNG